MSKLETVYNQSSSKFLPFFRWEAQSPGSLIIQNFKSSAYMYITAEHCVGNSRPSTSVIQGYGASFLLTFVTIYMSQKPKYWFCASRNVCSLVPRGTTSVKSIPTFTWTNQNNDNVQKYETKIETINFWHNSLLSGKTRVKYKKHMQ